MNTIDNTIEKAINKVNEINKEDFSISLSMYEICNRYEEKGFIEYNDIKESLIMLEIHDLRKFTDEKIYFIEDIL